MKLANLKEFKGRKFRVVRTFDKSPISSNVGNFDEAYAEMENFISSEGCHDDAIDLQEVK